MNIKNLSVGTLVTRNEPTPAPLSDRSYMGDCLKLVGVENGLIVLTRQSDFLSPVVLPLDRWGDGWVPYPTKLILDAS